MKKENSILLSTGFLIGLFLLLLNDFYLKYTFGNWFTGKLSDVAGLFIFPLFIIALFPRIGKKAFWGTALFFIWWKSPWSQSVIEGWNSLNLFQLNRVVDYSDLLALAILPFAYSYNSNYKTSFKVVQLARPLVFATALFSFCSTSMMREGDMNIDFAEDSLVYEFPYAKDSLYHRLHLVISDAERLVEKYGYFYNEEERLYYRRSWFNRDTIGGKDVIDASITLTQYKKFNALRIPFDYTNSAKFLIGGSTDTSFLKLIFIRTQFFNSYALDPNAYAKKKKRVKRLLERHLIKRLRRKVKAKK
jgi:hypothetical protein